MRAFEVNYLRLGRIRSNPAESLYMFFDIEAKLSLRTFDPTEY